MVQAGQGKALNVGGAREPHSILTRIPDNFRNYEETATSRNRWLPQPETNQNKATPQINQRWPKGRPLTTLTSSVLTTQEDQSTMTKKEQYLQNGRRQIREGSSQMTAYSDMLLEKGNVWIIFIKLVIRSNKLVHSRFQTSRGADIRTRDQLITAGPLPFSLPQRCNMLPRSSCYPSWPPDQQGSHLLVTSSASNLSWSISAEGAFKRWNDIGLIQKSNTITKGMHQVH